MNAKDREYAMRLLGKLKVFLDDMEALAEEVERWVMKKTTQRSPEWRGGANC